MKSTNRVEVRRCRLGHRTRAQNPGTKDFEDFEDRDNEEASYETAGVRDSRDSRLGLGASQIDSLLQDTISNAWPAGDLCGTDRAGLHIAPA